MLAQFLLLLLLKCSRWSHIMVSISVIFFLIFDLIDSYLICLSKFWKCTQQSKHNCLIEWSVRANRMQTLNCASALFFLLFLHQRWCRTLKREKTKKKQLNNSLLLILIRMACDVIFNVTAVINLKERGISLISKAINRFKLTVSLHAIENKSVTVSRLCAQNRQIKLKQLYTIQYFFLPFFFNQSNVLFHSHFSLIFVDNFMFSFFFSLQHIVILFCVIFVRWLMKDAPMQLH